ncbi:MAG: hypothetical protein ACKV19_29535 [Verrucomicrobiales bacterium]
MASRTRKPSADSTAATESKPARSAWVVVLAERDASGEWRTTGEPVPEVDFNVQADAYAYAQKRNKQWNAKFDWADDPSMAFVAVRADALGRLRSHQPIGEAPAERAPVGEEPAVRLAPARRGRPREREEDVQDDAEDADEDHDGERDDQDGPEDDGDGHLDEDEAGQMLLALG